MARKEKQYHFIYKTTNLLNSKYYYGMHSTNDLNDGYLGSGKRLRYSINKYGKDNHKREIIEFLPNRKLLIEREKEIVNLNEIAKENCMNLMVGGKGGFISKEQQHYRASCGGKAHAFKVKNDVEFRKIHNKIVGESMRKNHERGIIKYNTFIGKHHTKETKKKMSEKGKLRTGDKNSQFGTYWITNGIENKKIKNNDFIPLGWNKGRK